MRLCPECGKPLHVISEATKNSVGLATCGNHTPPAVFNFTEKKN